MNTTTGTTTNINSNDILYRLCDLLEFNDEERGEFLENYEKRANEAVIEYIWSILDETRKKDLQERVEKGAKPEEYSTFLTNEEQADVQKALPEILLPVLQNVITAFWDNADDNTRNEFLEIIKKDFPQLKFDA